LRSDSIFRVETPIGTAGIRGTRFKVTLSQVDNQLTMILANFDGSVVLERIFTLDTGEVVSDEILVQKGETVEYIVEIDIDTDEFRADPATSVIRSIRSAEDAREDSDELDDADEDASEFQQSDPVPPPSTRPTPPRSGPPVPPSPQQVRSSTPMDADDSMDEDSEEAGETDDEDDWRDDPPDPVYIPDPDVEDPSPSSNQ